MAAQRHRLALCVLVVAALTLGRHAWRQLPRQVDVEFALGPKHREIVEVRVAYLLEGQEMHGVAFRYPSGAPQVIRHQVSLPAGRYGVALELRPRRGRARTLMRGLRAPADGVVRILNDRGRVGMDPS